MANGFILLYLKLEKIFILGPQRLLGASGFLNDEKKAFSLWFWISFLKKDVKGLGCSLEDLGRLGTDLGGLGMVLLGSAWVPLGVLLRLRSGSAQVWLARVSLGFHWVWMGLAGFCAISQLVAGKH